MIYDESTHSPGGEEWRRLLEELPQIPLSSRADALETWIRHSSAEIRAQSLRLGAAILPDERLVSYLRMDDDAVLRNAGLEILKMRGGRGFRVAVELLGDPDPDVSLQAVLVLDHLKDPRALEPLRRVLHHPDTNVVQAAVVAIGHLGDSRAVADLIPFLEADPWLQMAAVEALGDLRSPAAVPSLTRLLGDLMLGPLAAEALARIGGRRAFEALAEHWLRFEEEQDEEMMLGLLAHVLEGLPRLPSEVEGLRERLLERLEGEHGRTFPAARSILALGPGAGDEAALEILSQSRDAAGALPPCLRHRRDLLRQLLDREQPYRSWGFLLVARHPRAIRREDLAAALTKVTSPRALPAVRACLSVVRGAELDGPLLSLYLRLPDGKREELIPALTARKGRLRKLVAERHDLDQETRLVLLALVGEPVEEVLSALAELADEGRARVLAHISQRRDILRSFDWSTALEERPDVFAPLAADVAVEADLRQVLPRLRELLSEAPAPDLIRAVGGLGDRSSVAILEPLLDSEPGLAPLVLEALGEIGGVEARVALRGWLNTGDADLRRIAYRALSRCATEEDEPEFVAACNDPDWNVRLACVEVLGRSARGEHLPVLARLAADPLSIVAQRAMSFLDL